jgi:hypothetical protein
MRDRRRARAWERRIARKEIGKASREFMQRIKTDTPACKWAEQALMV